MLSSALLFAQVDNAQGGGAIAIVVNLIVIALAILVIIGNWKLYEKAGKPGWASIIPIYNVVVLLEIVGRPIWWIILMLIPCVSLIVAIVVVIDLAKSFGKDTLYGLGLVFLPFIFFPMLGFSDARYIGPAAKAP
jgi:TRAP-type C4-dicarboxylate transport system permease small subunit